MRRNHHFQIEILDYGLPNRFRQFRYKAHLYRVDKSETLFLISSSQGTCRGEVIAELWFRYAEALGSNPHQFRMFLKERRTVIVEKLIYVPDNIEDYIV